MINLIVCGTPGTGKSTLIEKLKPDLDKFNFIELSKFAIENGCTSEYDETLETHVIDEDKLEKTIVPVLEKHKLNVIETIHADILPPELISRVFICRADNTLLYDRLKARSYNEDKISNNLESEIFQTIVDEAREAFDEEIIFELTNNNEKDLQNNVNLVMDKIENLLSSENKSGRAVLK